MGEVCAGRDSRTEKRRVIIFSNLVLHPPPIELLNYPSTLFISYIKLTFLVNYIKNKVHFMILSTYNPLFYGFFFFNTIMLVV